VTILEHGVAQHSADLAETTGLIMHGKTVQKTVQNRLLGVGLFVFSPMPVWTVLDGCPPGTRSGFHRRSSPHLGIDVMSLDGRFLRVNRLSVPAVAVAQSAGGVVLRSHLGYMWTVGGLVCDFFRRRWACRCCKRVVGSRSWGVPTSRLTYMVVRGFSAAKASL